MAPLGKRVPTLGEFPSVPYKYFGDRFLEADDFFARLDNEDIRQLAILGVNMPSQVTFSYMYGPDIRTALIPMIKDIKVNRILRNLSPEEFEKLKEKLKKFKWTFFGDKIKQPDSIYS